MYGKRVYSGENTVCSLKCLRDKPLVVQSAPLLTIVRLGLAEPSDFLSCSRDQFLIGPLEGQRQPLSDGRT